MLFLCLSILCEIDHVRFASAAIVTTGDTSQSYSGDGNATWNTGLSLLLIGNTSNGQLVISDGSDVFSALTSLGDNAGGVGTASLSGEGSTLNGNTLEVGHLGEGHLELGQGAGVTYARVFFAYESGSRGVGAITGSQSVLTSGGQAWIGRHGNAAIDVLEGGRISTGGIVLGRYADGSGMLRVHNGASGTNFGTAYIGLEGDGTLEVSQGGRYVSGSTDLGEEAGSSGAILVSDAGSSLQTTTTHIGLYGTGSLSVANGGLVTSSTSYLGVGAGSQGTAVVSGPESAWILSCPFRDPHLLFWSSTDEAFGFPLEGGDRWASVSETRIRIRSGGAC